MIVKLLTKPHLEFLSLKGGCREWLESRHVKMSNSWKSHATAHFDFMLFVCPFQLYSLTSWPLLLPVLQTHHFITMILTLSPAFTVSSSI